MLFCIDYVIVNNLLYIYIYIHPGQTSVESIGPLNLWISALIGSMSGSIFLTLDRNIIGIKIDQCGLIVFTNLY